MNRFRLAILSIVISSGTGMASAQSVPPTQVTPTNDTGVKALETYSGAHENISLANGNLSLSIPLVSLPGRNGLNFSLGIQYNSKIWSPHASYGSPVDLVYTWQSEKNGPQVGDMGWTYDWPFLHSGSILTDSAGNPIGRTPSIVTLPGGGKTSIDYGAGLLSNPIMDSQDGTFVSLVRFGATLDGTGNNSAIATLKDGTQVHFPCEGCSADLITDTNGNYIANGTGGFTDTLGRAITLTDAGTFPTRTTTISYKDSNGITQNVVLTLSAVPIFQTTGDATTNQYYTGTTPFQEPHPSGSCCTTHVWVNQPPLNSQAMMLTRIDMPGNMTYTFSYNGYGELIQVAYPSGGYTKYAYARFLHGEMFWATGGLNVKSDFREVVSKRTCRNAIGGCTPAAEDVTTYTPTILIPAGAASNLNNDSVDVKRFLDEANNISEKTTVQFTNDTTSDNTAQYYSPRETMRTTYAANGAPLRSVQTSYNVEPDLPGYPNLPSSVVATLYDVTPPLVTKTDTLYDTYAASVRWPPADEDGTTYQMQTIQARTRSIDNPVKQTSYDFGFNAPGNPLHIINTTWWKTGWSNHLWNRVLTREIQNGTGIRAAFSQFEYDNYTETVPSSGATHLAFGSCLTPPCQRGNQTAVSHWRNTDGAMLTSRRQYDDAGNVRKITDPLGHITTYSFADNWTGGNTTCVPASGFAAAYPTLVQNALGQQSVTTYNSCSGTVATHNDPNLQTTTKTYDALDRPLIITYPDGGHTSFDYHANALPLKMTKSVMNSPNPSIISSTLLDGLGREVQTSLDSSPGGPDVVDTTYDTKGRVLTQSNPHNATPSPTDGITTYQYDALNRTIQVAPPDGTPPSLGSPCLTNNLCTQFVGNTTTTSDQAGKQRRAITDGLGRLVEVDEPGDGAPGTIATGSVTISSVNADGTLQTTLVGGHPGAPGTGSVTIGGAEQSTSHPTHSTGSFTVQGLEKGRDVTQCIGRVCNDTHIDDSGSVTVTVGGFQAVAYYALGSTTASVAADLAGQLNSASSPVTASVSSATVSFTSKSTGTGVNFAMSTSSSTDYPQYFTPSFTVGLSGASMTGGSAGPTIYDAGNVTVTVGGHADSVAFGQTSSSSTIASGLASAINADAGALVTASASGGLLSLTSKVQSSAGNYSLARSVSFDSADFASASFSATVSGAALSGGTDSFGGTPVSDAGTVNLTVGSFAVSVSYGQNSNSTSTQVATALAAALNGASSPVTASAPGTTVLITYKAPGTAGNLAVSSTSSTAQTAYFSKPSFAGCPITTNPQSCSTALAGGAEPVPGTLNAPYVTLYAYDTLNDLLRVDQKGSAPLDSSKWRTRLFTYNSLSQLLTAYNPESGAITYSYDDDGELLQKTSPAPNQTGTATQTISYCYDPLHRVTGKAYSAQTCVNGQVPSGAAVVRYSYDIATNGVGRLTSLVDQAGTGSYNYDPMGRISNETRSINGASKSMSYTYYPDGSLNTMTYPSGAVVQYTPDSGGRPLQAIDNVNGIKYATGASYNPPGSIAGFISGNSSTFAGVTNTFSYNKRLQPINMSASSPSQTVFSIGYDFHLGAGNNGNVFGITNYKDNTRNQSFAYDALNRLTSAQNAGTDCTKKTVTPNQPNQTQYWGNTYGYDAWGNLLQKNISKCWSESLGATSLGNNQLSGYGYDAAGNMTNDPTDGDTLVYDPENRISTATQVTSQGTTTTAYVYDADGKRVEKVTPPPPGTPATGTLYWYMSPGIVGESDLTGVMKSEYVFFGGERVARRDLVAPTGVSYYFSDHLKTASVITDAAGTIKSESDYYPWGGELQFVANDSNHYKFTSKERDVETGLDYFGARYYSNELGRFITPDEAFADQSPSDPQSWNMYSYVRNNPVVRFDPNGRECVETSPGHHDCYVKNKQDKQKSVPPNRGSIKAWGNVVLVPFALAPPLIFLTPFNHNHLLIFRPENKEEARSMRIANASIGLAGMYAGFTIEEQAIADILTVEGDTVVPLPVIEGQKNPDAGVNGLPTEFKTLTVNGKNTLKNQIEEGLEQAPNVVVNARNTSVTKTEALAQIKRAEGNLRTSLQGRITIITKEGILRY